MIKVWGTALAVLALAASSLGVVTPGITLIGKGLVDSGARDKSGFKGDICQAGVPANCVSRAILGGFGSDLAYTGFKDVFIAAPDRGPFDGLTDIPYVDRFHFLRITTDLGAPFPNIHTVLLETRPLRNKYGETFVGAAGAFGPAADFGSLRLTRKAYESDPAERSSSPTNMVPPFLSSMRKAACCVASRCRPNF